MRLSCTLLCATALVSASAALAADLPTYKAPPAPTLAVTPPPYSWTGFYIGVGGGASALQVDSKSRSWLWGYNSSVTGDYHAHGGESSDLGKFGAFGTIEAGADYQMDRFVVGAFTNFDLQSLSAKSSSVAQASCSIASDNTCSVNASHHVWYKVGDSWDAGLRLGYLITDRNLLYALGGYSGAQISSGARIDGYATVDGTSYSTFAASSESQWKWALSSAPVGRPRSPTISPSRPSTATRITAT